MQIIIGQAGKQSLNANERKVLDALQAGASEREISQAMRIPISYNYHFDYAEGIPPLSVQGIITSIREKGYDIPGKDENMKKWSQEDKDRAIALYKEGKTVREVAAEINVPIATVGHWVTDYLKQKETPAAVAAATSEVSDKTIHDSTPIVTPEPPKVKHFFAEDTKAAVLELIDGKRADLNEVNSRIEHLRASIGKIQEHIDRCTDEAEYICAEIARLEEDYDVICGGGYNE